MNEFVEVQNWGMNHQTIISLITVMFTVFQGYGIIQQNNTIWKNRSVQSLPSLVFFGSMFFYLAFMFYGFSKNSLTIISNGLLGFLYLPIAIAFLKFGKLGRLRTSLLLLVSVIIPIMIIVPEKDIFLFILFAFTLFVLIMQPLKMIQEDKCGSVDIKYTLVFLLTNIFWFVYAYTSNNWVLQIANSGAALIYLLVFYLYYKIKFQEWVGADGLAKCPNCQSEYCGNDGLNYRKYAHCFLKIHCSNCEENTFAPLFPQKRLAIKAKFDKT